MTTEELPSFPGEWSLAQIQEQLGKVIDPELMESKKVGGQDIAFIPWYRAADILDKYAPGWQWEITQMTTTPDRLFLVGRLIIVSSEGVFSQCATGTELLKEEKLDKATGQIVYREIAYGDPASKAEGMAFRRAAAKFRLVRYQYDKEKREAAKRSERSKSTLPARPSTKAVAKPAVKKPETDRDYIYHAIGVQMKRLNWTTEQGKQYLWRTYSKSGRAQLSDDQLKEFLEFLLNEATEVEENEFRHYPELTGDRDE